jgi:transcription antitermination factor NusG
MSNSDLWFAVQTVSRQERAVASLLQTKGYTNYLPLYEVTKKWKYRTKRIQRPLFPGYLFCQLDERYRLPVLTTPGVIRILGVAKRPVAVNSDELHAVRAICDSGLVCEPSPFITAGERIRIQVGPLRGVEGIVLAVKNGLRLLVSVTLLQRSVTVELDLAWVDFPERAIGVGQAPVSEGGGRKKPTAGGNGAEPGTVAR